MDYTYFTAVEIMDFIQGRLEELEERKRSLEEGGTEFSKVDTSARKSELIHVRHTIMTKAQDAASEARNKAAEADPYPTLETRERMYKDAIHVQDACNLSGVVHAFSRHMETLSDMGLDTNDKNRHPVSVLFSSKIASLTGSERFPDFNYAYEQTKSNLATLEEYRETHGSEAMQKPQREDVGLQT